MGRDGVAARGREHREDDAHAPAPVPHGGTLIARGGMARNDKRDGALRFEEPFPVRLHPAHVVPLEHGRGLVLAVEPAA